MRLPSTDPTLEISTTSGMLRATVHPARSWPVRVRSHRNRYGQDYALQRHPRLGTEARIRNRECRELEWRESTENAPQRLQFEIRFRTITLAKDLTENQAIQLLTTLQQTLPNVAQQRRTLINAL